MNNETAIKFIAFIVLTVVPGIFIYNMLTAKNECETATHAYLESIKVIPSSPDAKEKEAQMQAICKAMGIQAEIYLKAVTPGK